MRGWGASNGRFTGFIPHSANSLVRRLHDGPCRRGILEAARIESRHMLERSQHEHGPIPGPQSVDSFPTWAGQALPVAFRNDPNS